ncbi:hypothetical protein V9L05_15155 [Bernardetia sp. Wsw4-3y2]|uniref:hypothetical protein n=1 Tax=Bernardetia sp. Wsw4-3y2 TaxID=3127471 RepID=UPI0030D0F2CC
MNTLLMAKIWYEILEVLHHFQMPFVFGLSIPEAVFLFFCLYMVVLIIRAIRRNR